MLIGCFFVGKFSTNRLSMCINIYFLKIFQYFLNNCVSNFGEKIEMFVLNFLILYVIIKNDLIRIRAMLNKN